LTFDDGSGPHAGVQLGDQIVPAREMGAPVDSVRGLLCLANPVRALRPLAESA
jgi:hypothetical protein